MGEEELGRIFGGTKLRPYNPPPPWVYGRGSGEEVSHKCSTYKREKIYYPYKVTLEGTKSGLFSVRVYDISRGYPKLEGRTSGMDKYEADELFKDVCDKLRGN